ncbi:MAG: hypothetical protein O6943_06460, partial [Bacteroidetes bacterium]|nr:hypothetical protein [Bacteroidota bacterium]
LGHHLKWIAIILSTLLVFQSCRVYHSKTATVEEATLFSQHIKIRSTSDETYRFKTLLREDGKLYGITWRKGSTASKLSEQIVLVSGKDKDEVKILLDENAIREYHLQNKTMSILIPILIPVILAALIFVVVAVGYGISVP